MRQNPSAQRDGGFSPVSTVLAATYAASVFRAESDENDRRAQTIECCVRAPFPVALSGAGAHCNAQQQKAITMSFEVWLAYVAAFTLLSLIPGPSVFMVIGQSLSRGLGAAFFCIAGDLLGGIVMMTIAYIGLGTLLATSSGVYLLVKWAGVAYMAWLGLSQILAARRMDEADLTAPSTSAIRAGSLRAGFLTGILNPKAILFYVAFLAQFMNPAFPLTPQFLILMATSTTIVLIVLAAYALLAAQARRAFQSLRARKRMGYAGGTFLLGGSAILASN